LIAFAFSLLPAGKHSFKVDDIIKCTDLVAVEGINLQRGMNFCVKPFYTILEKSSIFTLYTTFIKK
jgi:hypothetical protein